MSQGPRRLSKGNTPLTEADMIQFDKGLVEVKVSKSRKGQAAMFTWRKESTSIPRVAAVWDAGIGVTESRMYRMLFSTLRCCNSWWEGKTDN